MCFVPPGRLDRDAPRLWRILPRTSPPRAMTESSRRFKSSSKFFILEESNAQTSQRVSQSAVLGDLGFKVFFQEHWANVEDHSPRWWHCLVRPLLHKCEHRYDHHSWRVRLPAASPDLPEVYSLQIAVRLRSASSNQKYLLARNQAGLQPCAISGIHVGLRRMCPKTNSLHCDNRLP